MDGVKIHRYDVNLCPDTQCDCGASFSTEECPDSNGDYVRYSDHVVYLNEMKLERDATRAELAALREELATAKRVGPPHFCGLPMSLNPHPEAGVPDRFLEVGAVSECIPCLVSSRHGWAKTASELQQRLTAAEQRNARYESLLRQIIPCLAMSTNSTAPTYIRQINEALPQPTESGASE